MTRSIPVLKNGGTVITITGKVSEENLQKATAGNIKAISMLVDSNKPGIQQLADELKNGVLKPHISQVFAFADMDG